MKELQRDVTEAVRQSARDINEDYHLHTVLMGPSINNSVPQSIIQDLMLVENTQRRATKFICKSDTISYKDRLLRLRLLPLNYWLEYLDLVFFSK